MKTIPHPTQTPEYWESLAKDELSFARFDHNWESVSIRKQNAAKYLETAAKLRNALESAGEQQ